MKGTPLCRQARAAAEILCSLLSVLICVASVRAQEQTLPVTAAATPGAAAEPATDAVERRITRARALAAVGKLGPAASELEALRTSTADESVRDVARILLMGIYVEMPDYVRATALLDETFSAHESESQTADRAYFSLAGQTLNSVRAHIERYRTFGINISDTRLPAEVASDLESLRRLLEKVAEGARAVRDEELRKDANAKSPDATALLEDALTVRLRLARNDQEHADWQRQLADARQRLVASETRIASISGLPPAAVPPPPPVAAAEGSGAGRRGTSPPVLSSSSRATSGGQPANDRSHAKSTAKERAASSAETAKNSSTRKPSEAPPAAGAEPETATQKSGGGVPVAVGALTPLATQKVSPAYPLIARTARVSGLVRVYMVVDEKGAVESVERADGPAQLQGAARDAARRWKFRPTVVDGQPVRVAGFISFNFAL